jgi:hypothetical protein
VFGHWSLVLGHLESTLTPNSKLDAALVGGTALIIGIWDWDLGFGIWPMFAISRLASQKRRGAPALGLRAAGGYQK